MPGQVEPVPGERLGQRDDDVDRPGDDAVAEQRIGDAIDRVGTGRPVSDELSHVLLLVNDSTRPGALRSSPLYG